ncbi:hypothetical protein PQI07_26485 [Methylobacterium sp. 092160098-2]|uniref:hypothetical protein n=1 Tax=Methylobacterium sp. 092160098-2 TaxID=3025129 RepID=UPI002381CB3B|nr:hypothetical protein [Methylobacterium sp. 092160098-2]MDE4914222.1 hypothetical protein [Methylobacterium sp. 092160098-2]
MAAAPRILVEAFECLPDQAPPSRRRIGVLDLSDPISDALLFRRISSPPPQIISVGLFASALDRNVSTIAWEGRLAIPNLAASIDAFVSGIGGIEGIRRFRRHLTDIGTATRAVQRAEEFRDLVAQASFVPLAEAGQGAMFYCHLAHGEAEYVPAAGDAYPAWRYDDYVRRHPRPDVDFDAPERLAWNAGYDAWAGEERPPLVFLTTPVHFAGLDAAALRDAFEDDGAVDLPTLLASACEDHHEDAFEQLVDEDGLFDLVAAWLPHAGKGTAEDLALEPAIATWNGRQTLVSYMLDEARYTGTSTDVDAAAIARWCARHVERAKASLEEARIWSPLPSAIGDAPSSRAA